jgi:glycerol-3-phosphate dehydrogenase
VHNINARGCSSAGRAPALQFSAGGRGILKVHHLHNNGNLNLHGKTEDYRITFVLPWFGVIKVGTTNTESISGTLDRPYANDDDIEKIIRHPTDTFYVANIEKVSFWLGICALIDSKLASAKNVSRGHFFNNIYDCFI